MTDKQQEPKRGRGRPVIREIKIDAPPEEVARAIFSAIEPPDPSLKEETKGKTDDRDVKYRSRR